MLKWTLRATAVLAIAAAIATPVAVPAPEAVVATPAVAATASGPDIRRAELELQPAVDVDGCHYGDRL